MITNDMINNENFEGNYFSDDVAVKYDDALTVDEIEEVQE